MAERTGWLCLDGLDGPVLVFGGPYSNLQATREMRAEAARRGISADHCVCTGDVVAYCADPSETVAEIRDWGCHVIAGNCEQQLGAGAADCGCGFDEGSACHRLSHGWYAYADARLGADDRAWMAGLHEFLSFDHRGLECHVCHGGFTDVSRFLWPTSPESDFRRELGHRRDSRKRFGARAPAPDVVFSGHAGMPFARTVDATRWVNAGVIGMPPHDGAPATRFAILENGDVTIHALDYDHAAARAAMEAAGLAQGYHAALTTGLWPSQDILPEALRR